MLAMSAHVQPPPPSRRRSLSRAVGALFVAAVVLGQPAAALAQSASPSPASGGTAPGPRPGPAPEQVVLSGTVAVPKGRQVGEVVVFHGRATIGGTVSGDVVVLDGPITINGAYITGSVVALNGPIRIVGPALIGGDVLGADTVHLDGRAKVGGGVREGVGFTLRSSVAVLGFLLGSVAIAASVLLLGLLLLLLAPRGADRVATAAVTAPLASVGWGILLAILIPMVAVALMASILGLPLGLTVLLALAFIYLLGLAWAAWAVGRAVVRPPRIRALSFLTGWGLLALVGLIPFVNLGVWGLASVFGLGTMTVAAWRSRGGARGGRHRVGGASAEPVEPEEATPPPTPTDEPVPAQVEEYPATADD
jgi:hypothetical protein